MADQKNQNRWKVEEGRLMKAWEIEFETMAKAKPIPVLASEENWSDYETAGKVWNDKLYKDWRSTVPGSGAPCQLVVAAVQAMENRGYDVSAAETLLDDALRCFEEKDTRGLNVATAKIYAELSNAPKDKNSDYWNYKLYDSFEEFEKSVDFPSYPKVDVYSDSFAHSINGAWLAQLVGGAVGTQMEGYTTENIVGTYGEITSYICEPETYNDDITYELAFLDAFMKKGYGITSKDIAMAWAGIIPDGYSAEEYALNNIRHGIMPPQSGITGNWFYEWIGAQMRTAIHGMVAPGNPYLAAKLAWEDSTVSHRHNGVLGGVFNAVLCSLAFVENDVRRILDIAIGMIPKDAEYYSVVSGALEVCKSHNNWMDAWKILEERYKKYHWIHAYPNAAAEVLGLYYGDGDFDKTINIICLAGRDTDCNAAQILTVLGIINPEIDTKWTDDLKGVVKTYLADYKEFTIDTLVSKTVLSVIDAQ